MMDQGNLPYNFFWLNDSVAGSAHPGYSSDILKKTLAALKDLGLGVIVSLSPLDGSVVSEFGFVHVFLNTPDMGIPNLKEMNCAIDFVLDKLVEGEKILVHCGAGYGRTGLFMACLLVSQGMESHAAMNFVRIKRPGAIETKGQEDFIHAWAAIRRSR